MCSCQTVLKEIFKNIILITALVTMAACQSNRPDSNRDFFGQLQCRPGYSVCFVQRDTDHPATLIFCQRSRIILNEYLELVDSENKNLYPAISISENIKYLRIDVTGRVVSRDVLGNESTVAQLVSWVSPTMDNDPLRTKEMVPSPIGTYFLISPIVLEVLDDGKGHPAFRQVASE